MTREIGFYICNDCNDFIVSNVAYNELRCLGCGEIIDRCYQKEIDEKDFEKEADNFKELGDYYIDEFIHFATDEDFIKSELQGQSVTNWGEGKVGNTGFYELARLSPTHKGGKVTVFITDNKLVEEINDKL